MPLRSSAATGQQQQRILFAGGLGKRRRLLKQKPGESVGVEEAAVGEQAPLWFGVRRVFWIGPLNTAALVEHPVVGNARDIAGSAAGEFLENLKDILRRRPTAE